MSPRASIHRAAPYVLQLSTVSRVPAKTADGASGCNGAIGLTQRPSQTAVGRQTSTRIVARAARPARANLRPVTCERPDDEGHDRQCDQALDRPEPAPSDQVFTNL